MQVSKGETFLYRRRKQLQGKQCWELGWKHYTGQPDHRKRGGKSKERTYWFGFHPLNHKRKGSQEHKGNLTNLGQRSHLSQRSHFQLPYTGLFWLLWQWALPLWKWPYNEKSHVQITKAANRGGAPCGLINEICVKVWGKYEKCLYPRKRMMSTGGRK